MTMVKTLLRYLMGGLYVLAGVNHFLNPEFYLNIMPGYIPAHEAMVSISGAAEIALGFGVMLPATQVLSAWGIIAMLVVFFTVHVHMLVHAQDLYSGVPYTGLVARIPLQFLLIAWAWWYTRVDAGSHTD